MEYRLRLSPMDDEQTVAELLSRYAAGDRSFAGIEFEIAGDDLEGRSLDDADFSNSWICASFRGSSLRKVNFRGANLKTCDFKGADLSEADFTGAALEATDWEGATLAGTTFGEVSLYGAPMTEAEFLKFIIG
jgi:uncharacterized protein YjbI with pentapeptide repeats